jgi:tRNA (guanine-N7-)-methyltransferase
MKKRIRHHVNPLSYYYLSFTPDAIPVNSNSLEVELGCAEGDFLFRREKVAPGSLIAGVEIRNELVDMINDKAARLKVPVIGIYANLNVHAEVIFKPQSVDRFFVNFPDPWFKTYQHKRRVVTPALLKIMINSLKPHGEIFFQSDIFDVSLDAMAVLEEFGSPKLSNVAGEWSFYPTNPFNARTRREEKVISEGNRVWRILYRLS